MRRCLCVLSPCLLGLCCSWFACLPAPADEVATPRSANSQEAPASASPPADQGLSSPEPAARKSPDSRGEETPAAPRRREGPGPDGLTRDLVLRDAESPLPSEAVLDALDRRPEIEFRDTPLRDALRQLAEWGEFNLFLEEPPGPPAADPFAVPVSARFAQASLEAVLEDLLQPRGLDWHLRHDCLWVAPKERVTGRHFTRVYEATEILRGGTSLARLVQTVTGALDSGTDPGLAVAGSGSVLLVRGSQNTQREVAGLLSELEDLALEAAEDPAKQPAPQVGGPRLPVRLATFRPRGTTRIKAVGSRNEEELAEADHSPAARWLAALEERDDYDLAPRPLRQQLLEMLAPTQLPVVIDLPTLVAEGRDAALERPRALRLANARLEAALGVLLEPEGLTWIIHLDRVWITTERRAAAERELKVYDVANLLEAGHELDDLSGAVAAVLPGEGDEPGRKAQPRVQGLGEVLVVRASQPAHWELAQVLAELDELAAAVAEREQGWSPPFEWVSYPVPVAAAEGLAKALPELLPEGAWRGTARAGRPVGEIRSLPGVLLVRQTARMHSRVARLLAPWAEAPGENSKNRD